MSEEGQISRGRAGRGAKQRFVGSKDQRQKKADFTSERSRGDFSGAGEDTPQKVISALVPDILVKGGDYGKDQIVGKEVVESNGGRVVRVKQLPGRSTKKIIRKITSRRGDVQ